MALSGEFSAIDLAREAAFTLGRAEIRPATREVVCGETRELLEPRVMQVLVMLYRSRGEVVGRDDLIAHCWGGRVVGDDAVNRTIGRIRRLSESIGGFTLETIPRVGHRLLETAEALREIVPQTASVVVEAAPPAKRGTLWRVVAIAAPLLILAAGSAWIFWPRPKTVVIETPQHLSIAVLPFTMLYDDPEGAHLGDAIAAQVADTLSSGTRFSVIAPAESFRFRGSAKADAAKALDADFIIDGEVKKTPGWITASVRLVDGHDGTTLRTATLHRMPDEVATLPEYVATEVAGFGWIIAFGFGPQTRWDHHVIAEHLRALNLAMSSKDPFTAYRVLRQLANQARDNALAQTEFGLAAAILVSAVSPPQRPQLAAEARAAAEKAIGLDPSFGNPYSVFYLTTPISAWGERERLLRRGLSVVPESLLGQGFLIELLQSMGRIREAEPLADAAYAHAPYQDGLIAKEVTSRLWLGHRDEAITLAKRGTEMFERKGWFFAKLFEATAFSGDLNGAAALLSGPIAKRAFYPDGPAVLYGLMLKALRRHRADDVTAVVRACATVETRPAEIKQTCLLGLAALDRLDEAFALAGLLYPDQHGATPAEREKKWLATRYFPTAFLFSPVMAPLRADPRFADIVERMGLMAYWKTTRRLPDFCASEKAPVCAALKQS